MIDVNLPGEVKDWANNSDLPCMLSTETTHVDLETCDFI